MTDRQQNLRDMFIYMLKGWMVSRMLQNVMVHSDRSTFLKGYTHAGLSYITTMSVSSLQKPISKVTLKDLMNHVASSFISEQCSYSSIRMLLKSWQYIDKGHVEAHIKDEVFYTGPGSLLDKDKNPLIVMTFCATQIKHLNGNYPLLHTPTLHVSPDLFNYKIWAKFFQEVIVPASKERIALTYFNHVVPDNRKSELFNITVQVHELDFLVLKVPKVPLTTDMTKEMQGVIKDLKKLPKLTI